MLRLGLAATWLLAVVPAFHYERPVQLATDATLETCVVLPPEMIAHASPQLVDLRLFAGDREVAYQTRVSGDVVDERSRSQQILNLGERDGAVSFDVEMTEPHYNRVVLRMGRSQFSVLLRITGSQHPGEGGVAFPPIPYSAYAQEDDPQRRLIPLPESSFRYLHFELKTLALEPVRPQDITGVDVLTEVAPPPRYLEVASAKAPQQKPRETVYEFAVPANVPVDRLSFASDDANAVFSRTVTVHRTRVTSGKEGNAGDDGRRDRELPGLTETIGLARSSVGRDSPATKGVGAVGLGDLDAVSHLSTVTVTIHNGDDAPLALHAVALQMRERQLCFLRKPGTEYVLRYGDPALGLPQYDLSPIESAASTATISQLGAERALIPAVAEGLRPFTERHPVLLWVALMVVVGTLGLVAWRSAASSGNKK